MATQHDPWAAWLLEKRHGGDPERLSRTLEHLYPVRDRVLANAGVSEGDVLLDVGAGDGLLGFGALRLVGEGGRLVFSDISEDLLAECRRIAEGLGALPRCEFLLAPADDLSELPDGTVDVVTTRSVLIYVDDKRRALEEFHRVLKPGGRISLFEPINSFRFPPPRHLFWGYDVGPVQEVADKLICLYERRYGRKEDHPMLNFDERDLLSFVDGAGFSEIHLRYEADIEPRPPLEGELSWETFKRTSGNPLEPTVEEAIKEALTPEEEHEFEEHLRPLVERGEGRRSLAVVYLWAVK